MTSGVTGDYLIATVTSESVEYKVALPDPEDYIQNILKATNSPYEQAMLRAMQARLKPSDVVLDIGANVGNHTLFLSSVVGCRVVAFEPDLRLATAIQASAELNGTTSRVLVMQVGLGAQAGSAHLTSHPDGNIGGQALAPDGDIPVVRLDDIELPRPVRAIKIDVEGMELDVLTGGATLITEDRPLIYVEAGTELTFGEIAEWLSGHGYIYWETFNATPTHLFIDRGSLAPDQVANRLLHKTMRDTFRADEKIRSLRTQLHESNLKYRESTQATNRALEALESARRVIGGLEKDKVTIETDLARLKSEVSSLEKTVSDLRRELADQSDVLAQKDREKAEMETIKRRLRNEVQHLRSESQNSQVAVRSAMNAVREAESEAMAVRNSKSFRIGRELQKASRSPRAALRLPLTIWRLSRGSSNDQGKPNLTGLSVSTERAEAMTVELARPTSRTRSRRSIAIPPARLGPGRPLRIASIVDEFTANSLAPDCELHNITRESWLEELENAQPELLFVESAWRGANGTWHNAVQNLGRELDGMLNWCRERNVPTVFWNKEDPVHFSTFITAAGAFDYVFTTDLDCIAKYKAALGHDRVYLLPFACQPKVHNPIELDEGRKDAIVFAGSYYRKYKDRTQDLDAFLSALPRFREVEVFDRNLGSDDPNYAFPEEYQNFVVGSLPPEEIDRAYKGYRYAINLNSVKQSQTMFARRVVELLGSGTITVSNFSRAVRLLFGDLVITTDSGAEAVRRLEALDAEAIDKLRLLGVRSAMGEHTYADRLAFVAEKALGHIRPAGLPEILLLTYVSTDEALRRAVSAMARQTGISMRGLIITDLEKPRDLPDGITILSLSDARGKSVRDALLTDGLVAFIDPADYYGRSYALDLALATRYSAARAIGKSAHYSASGDTITLVNGQYEYRYVDELDARSSVVRVDTIADLRLVDVARGKFELAGEGLLSIDRFNYCRSAELHGADATFVEDLDANEGVRLDKVYEAAASIDASLEFGMEAPEISGAQLSDWFSGRSRPFLDHEYVDGRWKITSDLDEGVHEYVYATGPMLIGELWPDQVASAFIDATPGLNLQLVFIFKGEGGERLGAFHVPLLRNSTIDIPDGTTNVVIAFRALGPGETTIRALVLDRVETEPEVVLHQSRHLVLTNHYPSYEDLYRNGFVHSRVRSYADAGLADVEVFRLDQNAPLAYSEFEGVDLITGNGKALETYIRTQAPPSILIHFLNQPMWEAISNVGYSGKIIVWLHGAEVQPWWRREYNYATPEELEAAKPESDARLAFWKQVFEDRPENVHFVFVSQYFADEVAQDVGVTLSQDAYSIIHNPIDTEIFNFVPKPDEQRLKILSIRPYASAKYANDLAVEAIINLSREPWFNELEFRIIGDGVLFKETLAPLVGLENVTLEQRFLPQAEIADLHKEFGVFLVPTRMDAQGVSRDEAMASGLVVLTNSVAAIPEFVDNRSGIVVPPENSQALADGIRRLRADPGLFQRLSVAASLRVAEQSSAQKVRAAEMALFTVSKRT